MRSPFELLADICPAPCRHPVALRYVVQPFRDTSDVLVSGQYTQPGTYCGRCQKRLPDGCEVAPS